MPPESGDFGPCFSRTPAKFRRFDFGFDPKSLLGGVRQSMACRPAPGGRAGLKNGDVVTYSVAMDSVQGDPQSRAHPEGDAWRRDLLVTYRPRGETVEAWQ